MFQFLFGDGRITPSGRIRKLVNTKNTHIMVKPKHSSFYLESKINRNINLI
jgi:hypothetical protein